MAIRMIVVRSEKIFNSQQCTATENIEVYRFYSETLIECKHECSEMLLMVISQTRHNYFLL
jgi:hypothetical protein